MPRKISAPAARRRQHGRVGSRDARAVALLALTRHDNLVAQALLEKAISLDGPNYGQALGLLAACHTFSAHMGWEELTKVIPVAERAALAAIRADSEDAWAHYALASVYLFNGPLRRLHRRVRAGASAQSEFFARARHLWRGAVLSRALGRGRPRRARGAEVLSRAIPLPRSIAASPPIASISAELRGGDPPAREALRQRSDFVGAHRVLTAAARHGRPRDVAKAALEALRRAQPNISLAWLASRCRSSTRRTGRIIWRGSGGRGWGRGLQRPSRAGFRSSRPLSKTASSRTQPTTCQRMTVLNTLDIRHMIYSNILDIMEAAMQVSKWGNSLAVRLPKALVDALGLKEGDELNVVALEERHH